MNTYIHTCMLACLCNCTCGFSMTISTINVRTLQPVPCVYSLMCRIANLKIKPVEMSKWSKWTLMELIPSKINYIIFRFLAQLVLPYLVSVHDVHWEVVYISVLKMVIKPGTRFLQLKHRPLMWYALLQLYKCLTAAAIHQKSRSYVSIFSFMRVRFFWFYHKICFQYVWRKPQEYLGSAIAFRGWTILCGKRAKYCHSHWRNLLANLVP